MAGLSNIVRKVAADARFEGIYGMTNFSTLLHDGARLS